MQAWVRVSTVVPITFFTRGLKTTRLLQYRDRQSLSNCSVNYALRLDHLTSPAPPLGAVFIRARPPGGGSYCPFQFCLNQSVPLSQEYSGPKYVCRRMWHGSLRRPGRVANGCGITACIQMFLKERQRASCSARATAHCWDSFRFVKGRLSSLQFIVTRDPHSNPPLRR